MDATSFTWELRVAQAEALLQAAERDKNAALREEAELRAAVAAAARRADDERLALAQTEARRYGLAAELMTCAKTTEELRERAAKERSEATALKLELARLNAVLEGVRASAADRDAREAEAEARDLRRLKDAHEAPAAAALSAAASAARALEQTVNLGEGPRLSAACARAREDLKKHEAEAEAAEQAAAAVEAAAKQVGPEALAEAQRAARKQKTALEKAAAAAPDAVFRHERRRGVSAARLQALGREREALRLQLQQAERAAEAAAAALSAAAEGDDDF